MASSEQVHALVHNVFTILLLLLCIVVVIDAIQVLHIRAQQNAWFFASVWIYLGVLPAWIGSSRVRVHLSLSSLRIACSSALAVVLMMSLPMLDKVRDVELAMTRRWPESYRIEWTTVRSGDNTPLKEGDVVGTSWSAEGALIAFRWLGLGGVAIVPLTAIGTLISAVRKRRADLEEL